MEVDGIDSLPLLLIGIIELVLTPAMLQNQNLRL